MTLALCIAAAAYLVTCFGFSSHFVNSIGVKSKLGLWFVVLPITAVMLPIYLLDALGWHLGDWTDV